MDRKEALTYIHYASLILIAFVAVIFPSFFLTTTTEIFLLPKQLLVVFCSIALLLLFSARIILEGKITVQASPFNLPIVIFAVVILASSLFSRNMYDSLLQSIPVLMLFTLYFTTINTIKDKMSLQVFEFSLLVGAMLSTFITILQFLKIYIFPFTLSQSQYFNTHASVIQQLIYIVPLLVLAVNYLVRYIRESKFDYNFGIYAASSVVMGIGVIVIAYQIITLPQKPILLPVQYGFQIALASISQDTGRLAQSFLLGAGYGNFSTAFTRYKPLTFNNEQDLWSLVFSYSSSHFLELVTTTGLLGTLAFLFLTYKVLWTRFKKATGVYASLLVVLFLSFVLPFSFVSLFLLVMLVALFSSYLYAYKHESVYDFTLSLIAWKQSLINFTMPNEENPDVKPQIERKESRYLPFAFSVVVLLIAGFVGYYSVKLLMAEDKFRNSLTVESLNNGQRTYDLQRAGLADFAYKSDYFRVFSQINLALASSILQGLPPNSSPSAQAQQTVLRLLQQSIDSGRAAAVLAPYTSTNWIQLGQVYRNLIGVGQNAESFSAASLQQAIQLDPYNPNLYVQLGGIYFQLGLYEQAQNNFQIAVNLKPDFANARYNLGHAFEAKGDFQNAANQYQIVKQLLASNPDGIKQMDTEIEGLKQKAQGQTPTQQVAGESTAPAGPLEIDRPEATLPPKNPQIKISPPPANITPTVKASGSPTPTAQPTAAEEQ